MSNFWSAQRQTCYLYKSSFFSLNVQYHIQEVTLKLSEIILPPACFWKTARGIVLGSITVSAVSSDILPYISVAIKANFLRVNMCNICKNNILKMFLVFSNSKLLRVWIGFFLIFCKTSCECGISKPTW